MARKCQVTGAKTSFGNNVSHSNRRTRRKWLVNLKTKKVYDEVKNKWVKVRVSARALRTMNKKGVHATLKESGIVK